MALLLVQMGMVTASFLVLLVLPTLPLAIFFLPKRDWPEIVLGAILIGASCQAAIGLTWSHLVGQSPQAETALYLVFFVGLSLLIFLSRRSRQSLQHLLSIRFGKRYRPLLLILVAAFTVRSLHPMQTAALGQSDAYTHLHYLRYLTEEARLFNIVYPTGYHWILALPVLVFGLDPYVVARFGGAFFGTALVLAIYVLLDRLMNRRSAVFGSFCAACFPGMNLLIKTGIGAFANQFGLLLIPCILYLYSLLAGKNRKQHGSPMLFVIACLGLAASVPMMLLHLFIIFVMERLVALVRTRQHWLRQTMFLVVLCLPAVSLTGFHFWQAGSGQRFNTARVLMQYGGEEKATTEKIVHKVQQATKKQPVTRSRLVDTIIVSPYFHLVVDFFTIKRFGFANLSIDLMGWSLLSLFISCLGYGFYRQQMGTVLLGIWGALTTVQASTGFLQFSSYQREGWSLLVATCCLAGLLAGILYRRLGQYRVMQAAVFLSMSAMAWWTFRHPPGHPVLQSSAESLLIETVRSVGGDQAALQQECSNKESRPICGLSGLFSEELPLTIVTRHFVGWQNQGEIVANVLPPDSPVSVLTVDSAQGITEQFSPDRQYLVLLDQEKMVQPHEIISAFAMVAPSQVAAVLRQQKHLYRANERILSYLSQLSKNDWLIENKILSKNLTAYAVVPQLQER
ncbi:MAG: glycosyltransferase family 39 protein [Candidatus Electrothrix communis]|nr:MAG: glycosyltransferase family 39 protein [Candidatus Electrothrix communis]